MNARWLQPPPRRPVSRTHRGLRDLHGDGGPHRRCHGGRRYASSPRVWGMNRGVSIERRGSLVVVPTCVRLNSSPLRWKDRRTGEGREDTYPVSGSVRACVGFGECLGFRQLSDPRRFRPDHPHAPVRCGLRARCMAMAGVRGVRPQEGGLLRLLPRAGR